MGGATPPCNKGKTIRHKRMWNNDQICHAEQDGLRRSKTIAKRLHDKQRANEQNNSKPKNSQQ